MYAIEEKEVLVNKFYYLLLAGFTIIYLLMIGILEPSAATLTRYDIDSTQLRLLSLAIIIPALAIWFTAFYGLIHVRMYAKKVSSSREGDGFKYLSIGLIILGLSMPLNALISRFFTYAVQQEIVSQATATIVNTHLSVLGYFFGFMFLLMGAYKLYKTLGSKAHIPFSHIAAAAMVVAVVSFLYVNATLSNPSREVPVPPAPTATYYMPDWLIVTTIIIPYIFVWTFGLYTVLLLRTYDKHVKGKIYKKALKKLNKGFFAVILFSITLQFLTAASTSILGWGLGAVFVVLYVLLALIAVGFVYIALGAKSLAKLEEVT